jgi:hypothetical protein
MRVAEIRAILLRLQQIYLAAGAKGPAKDVKIMAEVLQPYDSANVGDFVADLNERLIRINQKNKGSRRSGGGQQTENLNEHAIALHVSRLCEARTQQSQFDDAFQLLNSDSSLDLSNLAEIARRYTNSVTKYRSLSAAHKAITQAFVRRVRFEKKLQ